MDAKVKEILEKQLELLFKHSNETQIQYDIGELAKVSMAMIAIAKALE